jgi:hypothetical protein
MLDANGDHVSVGFTELFERVDMDNSANFNSHLQKLTGYYIVRTEQGCEFRQPDRKVVS